MTEQIQLTINGHIATITLNRPEKLNALTPEMLTGLEAAADAIEAAPEVRVALLVGAGERAFCVGADIGAWSALAPLGMWREWVPRGHRAFGRLARLRQPLIAVLHAYAFGGGLELALACDIRLMATETELALPEVGLGTLPGWGGTRRLPALIGPARAKQLIFSGARVDATTAERWGIVNETLPRAELLARARALADEIASRAPLSVQLAKQLIDGDAAHEAGLTLEALAGALAATTDDGREGVAAFREKRPPEFRNS